MKFGGHLIFIIEIVISSVSVITVEHRSCTAVYSITFKLLKIQVIWKSGLVKESRNVSE